MVMAFLARFLKPGGPQVYCVWGMRTAALLSSMTDALHGGLLRGLTLCVVVTHMGACTGPGDGILARALNPVKASSGS